jgi:chromosome segregation ATPase
MFGRRARREIQQLTAEIDLLTSALRISRRNTDDAKTQAREWHNRAERFSDDLAAAARREAQLKLDLAARDRRIAELEAATQRPAA